jgi:hypothetical protein
MYIHSIGPIESQRWYGGDHCTHSLKFRDVTEIVASEFVKSLQ